MARIVHISPTYAPAFYWGGTVTADLARNSALVAGGKHDIVVLTTDSAGPQVRDKVDRRDYDQCVINHRVIRCRRVLSVSVSFELLLKIINYVWRAELVVLTGLYSFPVIPSLIAATLLKRPVLVNFHGAVLLDRVLRNYVKQSLGKRLLRRIYEYSVQSLLHLLGRNARIIVSSEIEETTTRLVFPYVRFVRLSNVFSSMPAATTRNRGVGRALRINKKKEIRFGFLGRLHPSKNVEMLIRAFSLAKLNNSSLHIFGGGSSDYIEKVERYIENLQGKGFFISYHGWVKPELCFRNIDVLVCPSYVESFAMVVIEALSESVPVIVTKNSPWADVGSTDFPCGISIEPDIENLVSAMRSISPDVIARYADNAPKYLARAFDFARNMCELDAVIEDLVS